MHPDPKPDRTPPKPRKPLRKVSEKRMKEGKVKKIYVIPKRTMKRSKEERQYLKQRKEFLDNRIKCEVKECMQRSTTVHHKAGRIESLLNDEKYWLAVCMPHHEYIEIHPDWAKEKGYSINRLTL